MDSLPGQTIHIGSVEEIGDDIDNGFRALQRYNDMVGYARVVSITNNSVVFDKVSDALQDR